MRELEGKAPRSILDDIAVAMVVLGLVGFFAFLFVNGYYAFGSAMFSTLGGLIYIADKG